MSEQILIDTSATRLEQYQALTPQIKALVSTEPSTIANLANTCAALRDTFGFFWIGFYIVSGRELVLGPFQGSVACTRIGFGKGVCGAAWEQAKTIIVENVDQFPGHIACSSLSKSEIVVPIFHNKNVIAVLDIDSDLLNDFSIDDQIGLEALLAEITPYLFEKQRIEF